MSNYDSMSGSAKLKGADFTKLRKELVDAVARDIANYPKQTVIKKAHSRTYEFDIPRIFQTTTTTTELHHGGILKMNKEDKTISFEIEEGNRAVNECLNSELMRVLFGFFRKMPKVGNVYGAGTDYFSEYNAHEFGQSEPDVEFYGGWGAKARSRR